MVLTRLRNQSASIITSGTIADARIAASSVNQHATSFDDNKIVNDISTLAIRQASNENKGAYNTNSMYVDVFQDGTGIASHTTSSRNASEYVDTFTSSTSDSSSLTINNSNYSTYFSNANQMNYKRDPNGIPITTGTIGSTNNDSSDTFTDIFGSGLFSENGNSFYHAYWFDFGSNKSFDISSFQIYHSSGSGNLAELNLFGFNEILSTNVFTGLNSSNLKDYELFNSLSSKANGTTWSATGLNTNNDFYRYIAFNRKYSQLNWGEWNALQMTGIVRTITEAINATGNFVSNAITAPSSVSSMGAIVTYQDNAGTNALNTDIVLQLSADNGSNFTTATLTAMPDFASGIKMAKVNDLSVTAGTNLKYKISFANQSSGVKEARIRGVSLQY